MIVTGVGSREAPKNILNMMFALGAYMGANGYTLRSGNAIGSDSAFVSGCLSQNPYLVRVFSPRDYIPKEAFKLAAEIHPNWDACDGWDQRLHARNIQQVLGRDLDQPSDLLICWTPGGEPVGGTRTAIVLAKQRNIPVVNMFGMEDITELKLYMDFLANAGS